MLARVADRLGRKFCMTGYLMIGTHLVISATAQYYCLQLRVMKDIVQGNLNVKFGHLFKKLKGKLFLTVINTNLKCLVDI